MDPENFFKSLGLHKHGHLLAAWDLQGEKKKLIMRNGADGIFGITSPRRSEMHLFTWLCLHCDHLSGSLLTFNLLEDRQGLRPFCPWDQMSEPPVGLMFAFLPTCKACISYSLRKHLVMLSRGSGELWRVPNLRAIAKRHGFALCRQHASGTGALVVGLGFPQRQEIPISRFQRDRALCLHFWDIFVWVFKPWLTGTADRPLWLISSRLGW